MRIPLLDHLEKLMQLVSLARELEQLYPGHTLCLVPHGQPHMPIPISTRGVSRETLDQIDLPPAQVVDLTQPEPEPKRRAPNRSVKPKKLAVMSDFAKLVARACMNEWRTKEEIAALAHLDNPEQVHGVVNSRYRNLFERRRRVRSNPTKEYRVRADADVSSLRRIQLPGEKPKQGTMFPNGNGNEFVE